MRPFHLWFITKTSIFTRPESLGESLGLDIFYTYVEPLINLYLDMIPWQVIFQRDSIGVICIEFNYVAAF